jgi:hypothetical protein
MPTRKSSICLKKISEQPADKASLFSFLREQGFAITDLMKALDKAPTGTTIEIDHDHNDRSVLATKMRGYWTCRKLTPSRCRPDLDETKVAFFWRGVACDFSSIKLP